MREKERREEGKVRKEKGGEKRRGRETHSKFVQE